MASWIGRKLAYAIIIPSNKRFLQALVRHNLSIYAPPPGCGSYLEQLDHFSEKSQPSILV
jgi:hypothetical protein